jgi:hypothetical protein
LEKKLGMRGTLQNNQFFRLRSFFVLGTDARKPWASAVAVIAGNNEQGSRLQLIGGEVRRRAKKYDAINLARHGLDRSIAGSSAAETASNNRYRSGAMRLQVPNRSEYVILKGRAIEVSLAGTGGAAESPEIDCQNSKSFGRQSVSLNPPALLIESAAVSKHHGAGGLAIEIGANPSTVIGGKRDALLCGGHRGQGESGKDAANDRHAEII